MIAEIDSALRAIVTDDALAGSGVEVAFDPPTKEWVSRRTGPTVCAYLYDISEDLRRRGDGFVDAREGARVQARHRPPRYFRLSYLVTAFTQRPEDEHDLLSRLLHCLINYQSLPTDRLGPGLRALGLAVPMTVAQPVGEGRSFADVWTALGGELRPSIDLVVSAPFPVSRTRTPGPPVLFPAVLVAENTSESDRGADPRIVETRRRRIDEPSS